MVGGLRSALFWLTWPVGGVLGFVIPFFAVWILVDAVGGAIGRDLDAAMDSSALLFALLLGLAFAAGGAGIGAVQWLHVRRDGGSAKWILGPLAGFALVAVSYVAIYEAMGASVAEGFWGRMANEVTHNLMGGALAGFLTWHFVLRGRAELKTWMPAVAFAFVAAGLTAWATEAAFGLTAGDAAPLAILVFGVLTAFAYRTLPRDPSSVPAPTA